jgi:hypothetical protein
MLQLSRVDPVVEFGWADDLHDAVIGTGTYSDQWSGFVRPNFTQVYGFYSLSTDRLGPG